MNVGNKYFWLRSGYGLVIILVLSTIPTFLLAVWFGNTSDYLALITGLAIANVRLLAWKRWGDGR